MSIEVISTVVLQASRNDETHRKLLVSLKASRRPLEALIEKGCAGLWNKL